jgi:hypothetical protein
MQVVGTQIIRWLLPKIALCNVHVLFILWKWTYFHTLIIKNVTEKPNEISIRKNWKVMQIICITHSYGCKQKNHVKAWLEYLLWNTKDSLLGHSNLCFSSFFLQHVLNFLPFFMSNEIILFQILYKHLKYLFFHL